MRGLRTQENEKFQRFFELIQREAKAHNAVFFADAGDGHEIETVELECEDMMGWLIPCAQAEQFERLWINSQIDDAWSDFFTWAVWHIDGGVISVRFEKE